jgi:hypothetical protein
MLSFGKPYFRGNNDKMIIAIVQEDADLLGTVIDENDRLNQPKGVRRSFSSWDPRERASTAVRLGVLQGSQVPEPSSGRRRGEGPD